MDDYFEKLCFSNHLIFSIGGIDDKDNSISPGVVTGPDGPDSLLST